MKHKQYLITLTGAKKNIGDFLITDRCEKLLKSLKPDLELVKLPHWEAFDDKLELINNSLAVVIFGGPGYQINMYPGVYKLVKNIDDIKVPIIPLGLGWKGVPGDFITTKEYVFSKKSLSLLHKINESLDTLSCRDYYTAEALRNNGIKPLMTGCPVWYNLDYIGKKMQLPKTIKKLVYTPAQMPEFKEQSVQVMTMLKEMFPEAEIFCSFHRGIGTKDKYTPDWDVETTRYLSDRAKIYGLIPVDTSFDLKRIDFYHDCDFHVGYRVHAHINFLSMRKPSLLIHEDGRGRGVSEALNIVGVDGFVRNREESIFDSIPKIRAITKKFFPIHCINKHCVDEVKFSLISDLGNNFVRYSGVNEIIDNNFNIMKKYILSNIK